MQELPEDHEGIFTILSEGQLKHSDAFGKPQNTRSINFRLGNGGDAKGPKSSYRNAWHSMPQLDRRGEVGEVRVLRVAGEEGVVGAVSAVGTKTRPTQPPLEG